MNTHSVYVCYAADGEVLYVGRTSKGERRVRQHSKASGWWPLVETITVKHCETLQESKVRELELIRLLHPKFNTQILDGVQCPDDWTPEQRLAFYARNPLIGKVVR